jgi:hypothetical protein
MDNRELIAAILTAGMLPTLPVPENRTPTGRVTDEEGDTILRADMRSAFYRSVLDGLGADPFAGPSRPR